MDEKRTAIEQVKQVFRGNESVDLYNSDAIVWVLEEHSHRTENKTHQGPRISEPRRVFVARQVAGGRSLDKKLTEGDKAFFHRYDLAKRAVLGPTTMENQLAFLMVNCACVANGKVAMDPFCGTGGILLALSHFGARVVGGEIDIRVVKGWKVAYLKNKEAARAVAATRAASTNNTAQSGAYTACNSDNVCKGEGMSLRHLVDIGLVSKTMSNGSGTASTPTQKNASQADIFTNFIQYSLPTPEIVICDAACRPWRETNSGWLDCIVTDPPYGVRAGMKKQGRDPAVQAVEIRDRATYIPSKVSYGDEELTRDLMDLAAKALKDTGRLVYLAPVDLADFLGIDRSKENGAGTKPQTLHDVSMPSKGRTEKDPRLCISETTRDPLLLDEKRYLDFLPKHADLELMGASLQVLSGGLGRLLVTFRRLPRRHNIEKT
jgi:tRNA (guanine10-N2)-methyltransferase